MTKESELTRYLCGARKKIATARKIYNNNNYETNELIEFQDTINEILMVCTLINGDMNTELKLKI